ncbi:PHO85 cyclin-5 [Dispira parvispora]|uniref:PHO85 cyclin-5 n=1 Tax=Dispira parvispora TaxID=1520584 RepID=A0A9W8AWW6_9FUNG|nr:PHO85 cyclin-5 [Dispira parvispora]
MDSACTFINSNRRLHAQSLLSLNTGLGCVGGESNIITQTCEVSKLAFTVSKSRVQPSAVATPISPLYPNRTAATSALSAPVPSAAGTLPIPQSLSSSIPVTSVPVGPVLGKRKLCSAETQRDGSADAPSAKRPASADQVRGRGVQVPQNNVETELVYDAICRLINVIWPMHSSSVHTQLCSLRHFIKETHCRSRLPLQILKLALFLLYRAKHALQQHRLVNHQEACVSQAESTPSTQASANHSKFNLDDVPLTPSLYTLSTPPASPEANVGSGHAIKRRAQPSLPQIVVSQASDALKASAAFPTPMATPKPVTPLDLTDSEQTSLAMAAVHALTQCTSVGTVPETLSALEQSGLSPTGNSGSPSGQIHQRKPTLSASASINGTPVACTSARSQSVPPTSSTASTGNANLSTSPTTTTGGSKGDPTRCGRRMYLAAMIAASKFYMDKTYSNKAWSRISTLKVSEVNHLEIAFMHLVNFDLHIDPVVFERWSYLFMVQLRLEKEPLGSSPKATHQKAIVNAIIMSLSLMGRTHISHLRQLCRRPQAAAQPQPTAPKPPCQDARPTETTAPGSTMNQLASSLYMEFFKCHPAPSFSAQHPDPLSHVSLCHYLQDYLRYLSQLVSAPWPPAAMLAVAGQKI